MKKPCITLIILIIISLFINNQAQADTEDCINSFKPYIYDNTETLSTNFKSQICNQAKEFQQATNIPVAIGVFQDGSSLSNYSTLQSLNADIKNNKENTVYLIITLNDKTVYLKESNAYVNTVINLENLQSQDIANKITSFYEDNDIEGVITYSQNQVIENAKSYYKEELEVAKKLGLYQTIQTDNNSDTVVVSNYIMLSKETIISFLFGFMLMLIIYLFRTNAYRKRIKAFLINKEHIQLEKDLVSKGRNRDIQKENIELELESLKNKPNNESN